MPVKHTPMLTKYICSNYVLLIFLWDEHFCIQQIASQHGNTYSTCLFTCHTWTNAVRLALLLLFPQLPVKYLVSIQENIQANSSIFTSEEFNLGKDKTALLCFVITYNFGLCRNMQTVSVLTMIHSDYYV